MMLSKSMKSYLAIQSDTEPPPSACPLRPLSAAHRLGVPTLSCLQPSWLPFVSAADSPPALLLLIYCQVFPSKN